MHNIFLSTIALRNEVSSGSLSSCTRAALNTSSSPFSECFSAHLLSWFPLLCLNAVQSELFNLNHTHISHFHIVSPHFLPHILTSTSHLEFILRRRCTPDIERGVSVILFLFGKRNLKLLPVPPICGPPGSFAHLYPHVFQIPALLRRVFESGQRASRTGAKRYAIMLCIVIHTVDLTADRLRVCHLEGRVCAKVASNTYQRNASFSIRSEESLVNIQCWIFQIC